MIPEAAVEAAAKAHAENGGGTHWEDWEQEAKDEAVADMRAALEAAAPHITAQSLDEAANEVSRISRIGRTPADDCTDDEKADYYAFESQASPEGWLRARAQADRSAR